MINLKLINRNILFSLFALIFFFFNSQSTAQNNTLKFNHLTVKNGLSQNTVLSITQDKNGFMWFGTRAGGLNMYDGYSFTSYEFDENDSTGISGNEVISLIEDSEGVIWVGTRYNGLNRFNHETAVFQTYYRDKNDSTTITDNTIGALYEDINGLIWVGTNKGLCYYDRERSIFVRINDSILESSNIKIIEPSLSDSLLWIGTKNGLILFDNYSQKRKFYFKHNLDPIISVNKASISSIFEAENGYVWFGTSGNGIYRIEDLKEGKFSHFVNDPEDETSLSNNKIRTLHGDKNGNIWIGTKLTLERILPEQQKRKKPIFQHHSLDDEYIKRSNQNSIFSFYEDKTGSFWIGTWSGGVSYLYNGQRKFEHYKNNNYDPTSLNTNIVSSIVEDDEAVWVGTEGGGLNTLDRKTGVFRHYLPDNKDPNSICCKHIKSLALDNENNLWIGTYEGLQLYNRQKDNFKLYLKGTIIYSITGGVDNELWIGTSKGLIRFSLLDASLKTYVYNSNDENSLSNNAVNIVYKDSDSNIWIGTKRGLSYYNRSNDNFTNYRRIKSDTNSISDSHITSISEDIYGNIWVGTLDGLNRFDVHTKIFKHYGKRDGIISDIISNILSDNEGSLWITTNNTLTKFKPNLIDTSSASPNEYYVRHYDVVDGLQANQFISASCFKSKSGELFFGGYNGFNVFHPNNIKDNPEVPNVFITEFKLFNKLVTIGAPNSPLEKHITLTKSISLNHNQSIFSFGFVALNYTSPLKNQYAYMIEGFDKDWNYIGNKREATYTNLPAGEYIFRVRASNNDGIWNEQGASIELIILPPWWKTWWFRLSVIIFVLFAVYRYSTYRLNALTRQRDNLEKNVRERTHELQAANEKLNSQKSKIEKQAKELQKQKESLEETNATKDKFFSILAHDLKNPLGTLLGFLELIKLNYSVYDEERRIESINIAFNSAETINNLVANLLNWSRAQQGSMPLNLQPINIKLLIDTELSLLDSMISKKELDVIIDTENENSVIQADLNMLSTVVRNIVSNAIKFSYQGGKLKIKISDSKEYTLFEISDMGIGIPQEFINKLFRIDLDFTREGTANEKGTGMGLALCREFIESHKGKIWASSEEDMGTTISFTIPKII